MQKRKMKTRFLVHKILKFGEEENTMKKFKQIYIKNTVTKLLEVKNYVKSANTPIECFY